MKYFIILTLFISANLFASNENTKIHSFSKAKKLLEKKVYTVLPRSTIYCAGIFDKKKNVINPNGFASNKHKKRAKRIEWEHVVPAENFGKTFIQWREGDPSCVNRKGKNFKGRKCASKTSKEYKYMQADMYNLFPAIGAVNALRSNYNFVAINSGKTLGQCKMIISKRKVVPTNRAKGIIARTYMYMDKTYDRYNMSSKDKKLFLAWNKMYPITKEECTRAKLIKKIQGNTNIILEKECKKKNLI